MIGWILAAARLRRAGRRYEQGRYVEAARDLEDARAARPGLPLYQQYRGVLALKAGRLEEAEEALRLAEAEGGDAFTLRLAQGAAAIVVRDAVPRGAFAVPGGRRGGRKGRLRAPARPRRRGAVQEAGADRGPPGDEAMNHVGLGSRSRFGLGGRRFENRVEPRDPADQENQRSRRALEDAREARSG
jgi:tetratricopeptide (TPR) repeat protein